MAYKGKLPIPVKLGYGLGTVGDSVPYNLFFTYFLFYLTDVAGISPAIAGIIAFLSVSWDAITDPVVGYLSDKSKNPKGRRRPWMIKSIWPLGIIVFFIFLPNNFGGSLQVFYYVMVAILLWTFYTTFTVPWGALGAEITQDYNERNNTRMYIGIIAYIFVALCNSGPMYLIGHLMPRGWDIKNVWGLVGIIAALIIFVLGFISWRATKGHEIEAPPQIAEETGNVFKNFFIQYKELLKIRIFRILIYVGIVYLTGFTIFNTSGVYMLTYCAKLAPEQQGSFWVIYTVAAMVCTPIPIKVANVIGKKPAVMAFSFLFSAVTVFFYFFGLEGFITVVIFGCFVALTTSAFWGLYFSFIYDVTEIDEYRNNRRREGGIIALAQFFQKFGGAIATSFAGIVLSLFGYTGAAEQTAEAINGILMMSTIIPGAFIALSMIIMTRFPLNKRKFDAIKEANILKKEGKESEVDESTFIDCIK